jgi:putative membrane protein
VSDSPALGQDWQRLDRRMLLVHPIKEIGRFFPALIGVFIAGSQTGGDGPWFEIVGVAFPIVYGVLRYYTTRYRIGDGRIELRRGLLTKHVLSTQLDRVRTVDLTSSPIHRILGLTTVRIGTGTASTKGEDQLDLDSLPTAAAQQLRYELLHAAGTSADRADASAPLVARTVVRFDPSWLRFAPLTSAGLVSFAAIAGVTSQVLNGVGFFDQGHDIPGLKAALWVIVVVGIVLGLASVSALAIVGYLVTNWDFSLTHTSTDGSWHLRRGLLTTRETSMDDGRVRGVAVGEPLGLRLGRGARLSAIVTGLDKKQQGTTLLVPPAPRQVVDRVAADVIGTTTPLEVALTTHGPAATRRRWIRALALPTLLLVLVGVLIGFDEASAWWLLLPLLAGAAGAGLAADRAASLGHALVDGWLVVRSGSLVRRRELLQTDGVIGWNLRSTYFQRRVGLTTLVATTAGGSQSYAALDVPEARAIEVARLAQPQLIEQFLAP